MPQGPGTYGSAVGRPPKKRTPAKAGEAAAGAIDELFNQPEKEDKKIKVEMVGKSPTQYTPFKMKAADYDNSPMKKNFPNDIGNSPANFFGGMIGKNIAQKAGVKGRRKQMMDPLMGKRGGGAIPHGDEAHTGGGGGEVAAQEVVGAEGAGGDVANPFDKGANAAQLAGGNAVEMAKKVMARKRGGGLKGRKMGTTQAGGGGGFVGLSDARLKENIEKIGTSPSNIPIYKFNYKGRKETWSGTMAQDLLIMGMNDVVTKDKSGHYIVNYDKIDVDMHLLN